MYYNVTQVCYENFMTSTVKIVEKKRVLKYHQTREHVFSLSVESIICILTI